VPLDFTLLLLLLLLLLEGQLLPLHHLLYAAC
jgi:hypothetical protein